MRVGFTGTREGMTPEQRIALRYLLLEHLPKEVHHGDCLGADSEFHNAAIALCCPVIVIHPPSNNQLRAFCGGDAVREPKPYLDRNRDIVDETDVLIAAPKEMEPPASLKGHGTWSTYFYAKDKAKKRTYLVLPDGTVSA